MQDNFRIYFSVPVSFVTFLTLRKVKESISFLEFIPHFDAGLRKVKDTTFSACFNCYFSKSKLMFVPSSRLPAGQAGSDFIQLANRLRYICFPSLLSQTR
jgi:hypothetical protein